jgi:hypothetical protein
MFAIGSVTFAFTNIIWKICGFVNISVNVINIHADTPG